MRKQHVTKAGQGQISVSHPYCRQVQSRVVSVAFRILITPSLSLEWFYISYAVFSFFLCGRRFAGLNPSMSSDGSSWHRHPIATPP